jgi:hypothetical protein
MIGAAPAAIIGVMARRTGIDPRQIEVIDDRITKVLREKSGAQRLKMADGMYRFARSMVIASTRQLHPNSDDAAGLRETARRMFSGPPAEWKIMLESTKK